jgi:hypothetical protein
MVDGGEGTKSEIEGDDDEEVRMATMRNRTVWDNGLWQADRYTNIQPGTVVL